MIVSDFGKASEPTNTPTKLVDKMRTTHATARWGLLALLALVASVGCQGTDSLSPEESAPRPDVTVQENERAGWDVVVSCAEIRIPESWAKGWETRDHCGIEERQFRETGYKPPPWESYCHNPRPLRTGLITAESLEKESQELKREWDKRYSLTPLGAESK